MVYEARKQSTAWMETTYSKHRHFRWKIKWRLEHLDALGIMGETVPLSKGNVFPNKLSCDFLSYAYPICKIHEVITSQSFYPIRSPIDFPDGSQNALRASRSAKRREILTNVLFHYRSNLCVRQRANTRKPHCLLQRWILQNDGI